MSLKNNKLLKKKWITTPLIIFVYFIFLGILPRFTGWITIIGAIGTGVYLVAKSEKFKSYNRIVKSSIIIILGFFVLIGSGFTTITPEKIQQSKLAAEKIKLENKNKKEAEEKAKKEEETRKVEEEKTKATNASGNGELKVHFIDVGQADSILIQQGNASMLIDAGNNDDDKTIKNYLDSHGIKELTYVIGTHSHEDHIGGLDYIINSLKVGKVYFPKQTATTKTFKDFTGAVKGKGLQLTEPKVGESFNLGEAKCTMLAPNGSSYEDTNDYSIVIKLTYGGTSFLFTGDAEAVSEMEMVNAGVDLKANVLKVGHHGSKSSTCANFLDIVNPQYAVISVGKDNEYGHPVQSTMDRLKNKHIKVYRTDEQGTIIATSNGKEITFDKDPGSYTGKVSAENNSSNNSNNNLGDNSNNNSSNNLENNSNNNANNNLSNNSRKTVSSEASSTKEITPVTPPLSNNNTSATTQTNNGGTVYWLSTGKSYSYHKDLNCRYIKGKQTNSGSIQDAINSKHGDPCDKCVH